ncbi:hypothetical protein DPSP01_002823 [Paraphaeosphaeria sporulosa]|uniref:Uncharacterized protein n=1 Tax=Paraphaeosphaeria sporulosa TaxID=1460663 RepID=A0A177CHV2_9PLEO|nr:uncharacterized protein CC84DRAFT_764299 [Paraphaeosphaeria sporulosa]OAG06429.1 hypothetical protein CC84DRAFT_764299 [Paraphaeosphaeria sporulosa]
MPAGIIQSAFPQLHRRSSSSTDISKSPKSGSHTAGTTTPTKPAAKSPKPQRPQPVRAASHPGPAPVSRPAPKKQPARAFGTNYRVRRTPPGTPPNERVPSTTTPSPFGSPAHPSVRDFAKIAASASPAHSPPTRRKPVYSLHEADPAAKGRPEVVYTHEELLKRLNTIGEDEETDVDRVKTVERAAGMDWEEQRRRKEERDMEEWNRKEAKKAQKGLVRGFSWKGVKKTMGGFR